MENNVSHSIESLEREFESSENIGDFENFFVKNNQINLNESKNDLKFKENEEKLKK